MTKVTVDDRSDTEKVVNLKMFLLKKSNDVDGT